MNLNMHINSEDMWPLFKKRRVVILIISCCHLNPNANLVAGEGGWGGKLDTIFSTPSMTTNQCSRRAFIAGHRPGKCRPYVIPTILPSSSSDSLQRGGSSLDRDDVTGRRRNRSHSPPDRSRGHNSYHGGGGEDRGGSPPYPRGGGSPPYPYHHHGPYPPPFYPPMYPYPSPMMYPGTPGMMPQPVAQSTPTHIYIPVATPSAPVATPIIPVATPTQNHTQNVASQPVTSTPSQPQPNVTVSHHISTSTASAVSRDSGVGGTILSGGGATTVIGSSEGGANSIRVAAVNREQQRQISMLLVELDASKNLNKEVSI